jgi:hypothetical protein
MGGGPRLPSLTASMHRAPAAMVTKPVDVEIKTPRDPNTLSNYHNYVTKHTSIDFEIEFEKKRLVGKVVLRLESLTDEEVDVILDSRCVFVMRVVHYEGKRQPGSRICMRNASILRMPSGSYMS